MSDSSYTLEDIDVIFAYYVIAYNHQRSSNIHIYIGQCQIRSLLSYLKLIFLFYTLFTKFASIKNERHFPLDEILPR